MTSNSPNDCPDVHAANGLSIQTGNDIYDTVGLAGAAQSGSRFAGTAPEGSPTEYSCSAPEVPSIETRIAASSGSTAPARHPLAQQCLRTKLLLRSARTRAKQAASVQHTESCAGICGGTPSEICSHIECDLGIDSRPSLRTPSRARLFTKETWRLTAVTIKLRLPLQHSRRA